MTTGTEASIIHDGSPPQEPGRTCLLDSQALGLGGPEALRMDVGGIFRLMPEFAVFDDERLDIPHGTNLGVVS